MTLGLSGTAPVFMKSSDVSLPGGRERGRGLFSRPGDEGVDDDEVRETKAGAGCVFCVRLMEEEKEEGGRFFPATTSPTRLGQTTLTHHMFSYILSRLSSLSQYNLNSYRIE